jgi:hypothetical protein
MSRVIDRWHAADPDNHYAAVEGFERDVSETKRFRVAYDAMDIYDQIDLFALVCRLLAEESDGGSNYPENPEGCDDSA